MSWTIGAFWFFIFSLVLKRVDAHVAAVRNIEIYQIIYTYKSLISVEMCYLL